MTAVVEQGLGTRLIGAEEAVGNFTLAGMAYSEQFAAQTDTARRLMVGYLRGVRAYLEAFTRNQGRPEVVEVLVRHTAVKDPALYDRMQMPYMNPDGAFNTYAYDEAQRYFIHHGIMAQTVDMGQIVDNSFADYAAQQLGPHR